MWFYNGVIKRLVLSLVKLWRHLACLVNFFVCLRNFWAGLINFSRCLVNFIVCLRNSCNFTLFVTLYFWSCFITTRPELAQIPQKNPTYILKNPNANNASPGRKDRLLIHLLLFIIFHVYNPLSIFYFMSKGHTMLF